MAFRRRLTTHEIRQSADLIIRSSVQLDWQSQVKKNHTWTWAAMALKLF